MNPSPIFARGFRCKSQTPPPTPTNRERIQAYRALAPVELGNGRQWEWIRGREYERQEAAYGRERYATGDHRE